MAFYFHIAVGRDESEGTLIVLMQMRGGLLCEFGGSLVAVFEGGFGKFLFDKLSGMVGEFDGLIEFACGGSDVGSDEEIAHDVRNVVDVDDLTLCVKGDRLCWAVAVFILESVG